MSDYIHLHPNKSDRDFSIFLLLIPAILFITTILFLMQYTPKHYAAIVESPSVLGETTQE